MELKHISIDTSKHVFMLHGVDGEDRVVLRRELRRGQVDTFFTRAAPTEIALEACAGSHRMGRTFRAMGHQVKLIPPQYVKPFVKRSKNDRNDAQAINEAASRPSMRTVPVRTVDEQAATMIVKHRPGDQLETKAIVDHGEPAGCERHRLTIGAGHMLRLSQRARQAISCCVCLSRTGARNLQRQSPNAAINLFADKP